jgi:hypothetical protein
MHIEISVIPVSVIIRLVQASPKSSFIPRALVRWKNFYDYPHRARFLILLDLGPVKNLFRNYNNILIRTSSPHTPSPCAVALNWL